jgi:hypothetical protein
MTNKLRGICKKYFQLPNAHLIDMIYSNVEKTQKNRHDDSPTTMGTPCISRQINIHFV